MYEKGNLLDWLTGCDPGSAAGSSHTGEAEIPVVVLSTGPEGSSVPIWH